MIKPNLPGKLITKAIASCDISERMKDRLQSFGIKIYSLYGKMNCDNAVKNHPDLYLLHCSADMAFSAKNICSIIGEDNFDFVFRGIETEFDKDKVIKYPEDVFLNSVILGNKLICCKKFIHTAIAEYAERVNLEIINVNQGYTKCNICVVNDNAIITEDYGIANVLLGAGFEVLLLEKNFVKLQGYKYGFIGGASGKIAEDRLAFFGDVTKHPEYDRIYAFLKRYDVAPISLSNEALTDFGSLIPIE